MSTERKPPSPTITDDKRARDPSTAGAHAERSLTADELAAEFAALEGAGEAVLAHPGPARAAPRSISEQHLKGVIESLVFASDKPMTPSDIARIARADARDVRRLLEELREEYKPRGVHLDEVAGGWQFRSSAANAPFVRELLQAKPVKLTRAQVETLAIVVYRQPVTRPEIDEIRGVDSGGALKVLLERELVRMMGRKEEAGRPVLYGTTPTFLQFFGLKSLRDLPTLREFTELTAESEAELSAKLMSGALDRAEDAARPEAARSSAEPRDDR
jgi:segregation and condensation protein B